MPASLENSSVATRLKKSVFIPIPKKGNTKECSNHCTITLISQASKVMLKILVSSHVIAILYNLDLEKTEESEIKVPTSGRL